MAALGYAHPRIVETLKRQAETLTFQSNAVALSVRARAGECLAELASDALSRVFFVNSGAEANENALRVAFRHNRRDQVVAIEHGFHGRTAAAGAVTWGAMGKWYAFPRTPFEVTFVPRDDVDALRKAVSSRTAAVIAEPVQGVAGACDLAPEFLRAMRRSCDEQGAVLIHDEVQSGMGRSGYGFAAQAHGVEPDIRTTAKSLGGGFPVGAVLMKEKIADSLSIGDLGTTFGGGPLACALVEAVIQTIRSENLMDNVRRLSALIRSRCIVGPVESIQGAGFLLGLRVGRARAAQVRDDLLDQGILVGTSADPHVVRLMPPLTLQEEHVTALSQALGRLRGDS